MFGDYAFVGNYRVHPDPNQEAFFFGLLRECVDKRIVDEQLIREEMKQNHVRHDAFEVMDWLASRANRLTKSAPAPPRGHVSRAGAGARRLLSQMARSLSTSSC
jgi:hypothetical protein